MGDLDQHLLFKDTILDREKIYASGDQFLNDFTPELAELLVPAGVVIGQLVIVKTEQVQPGDVDVTDMVDALHRLGPDLVGGADGMAGIWTVPVTRVTVTRHLGIEPKWGTCELDLSKGA